MTKLTFQQFLAGLVAMLVLAAAMRAQAFTFRTAWVSLLGLGAYRLSQKRLA